MPRNFTPADRETVREKMDSMEWVHDTVTCGTGLIVQESALNEDNTDCFGSLMQNCGWYLDARIPRDGGAVIILMPVTEVPE